MITGRRVRARKDEALHPREARRVEKADGLADVRLERPQRVGDGIRDARPGRQVGDGIGALYSLANRDRVGK